MECDDDDAESLQPLNINDLPTEILQFIFSLLSPYGDWAITRSVCTRWRDITDDVGINHHPTFCKAVKDLRLEWCVNCVPKISCITPRYSHCAVYFKKKVYVFGGCTATQATFNDLWTLDLHNRSWSRLLAQGNYPSPKAYSSMVVYNGLLILFGGWSHPTPYPLHQAARFFNQVHLFNPITSSWTGMACSNTPMGRAGHAASVVGDSMIVFGGAHGHGMSCDEVWELNLKSFTWRKVDMKEGAKPRARYGHHQVVLDLEHILVIGGCGGPNMQHNDAWLLCMDSQPWRWQQITIQGQAHAPPQLWCHAAVLVGDNVVVLSKATHPPQQQPRAEAPAPSSSHPAPPDARLLPTQLAQLSRILPDSSESSGQDSSSDTDTDMVPLRVPRRFMPAETSASRRERMQRATVQHGVTSNDLGVTSDDHASSSAANRTPQTLPSTSNNEPMTNAASASTVKSSTLPGSGSRTADNMSPGPSTQVGSPATSSGLPSNTRGRNNSREAIATVFTSHTLEASSSQEAGTSQSSNQPSTSAIPAPTPGPSHVSAAPGPSVEAGSSRKVIGDPVIPFRVPLRTAAQRLVPSVRPNASKNRQKQLDTLRRFEERLRGSNNAVKSPTRQETVKPPRRPRNVMYVHNLDVSSVLTNYTATWQPLIEEPDYSAPDETIFFSLVHASGELVLFGGIQSDFSIMQKTMNGPLEEVTNEVHILRARREVH